MANMGGHELGTDKTYFIQVINDIKEGNMISTVLGDFKFTYTKELEKLYNKFNQGKEILYLMKDGKNFKQLFIDTKTNTALPWSAIDKTPYSIGNSIKPTTKQQEDITLMIFRHLLTSSSIKSFDEFVDETLEPYWDDIRKNPDWYKSFKLQYDEIFKETKLKNSDYNEFDRDSNNGLMERFTKIAENMGFRQKDAWDPADIWLSKKGQKTEKIIQKMEESSKLRGDGALMFVNRLLRIAYREKLILGISLKKNNGKQLKYELVNLKYIKSTNIYGKFDNFYVSNEIIKSNYKLVSGTVNFNYNNMKVKMAVRRYRTSLANITYEFKAGSAAQLGKVPLDQLSKITKKYTSIKIETWRDQPQKVEDIDDKEWIHIFESIKASQHVSLTKNKEPKTMLSDMKKTFKKGKLNKDNLPTLMIYKFAYILSNIKHNKIDEYMTELYFAAQKKGKGYGGFGKLY